MICPYCKDNSPYTWRRYWRSPGSRVKCSECDQMFKISISWKAIGLYLIIMVLFVIPIPLLLFWDMPCYSVLCMLIELAVLCCLDKQMENSGIPVILKLFAYN